MSEDSLSDETPLCRLGCGASGRLVQIVFSALAPELGDTYADEDQRSTG